MEQTASKERAMSSFTKRKGQTTYKVNVFRREYHSNLALCIVSVTLALIAVRYIPVDINVVSWRIGFSV